MTRFYVGQRVRVVHSRTGLNAGLTGIVIATGYSGASRCPFTGFGTRITDGLRVRPDKGGRPWLDDAWRFEPLIDPGRQVVSWEGAIWMPEHLREAAPESEGASA